MSPSNGRTWLLGGGGVSLLRLNKPVDIVLQYPIKAPDEPRIVKGRECSKKFVQQGRSLFDARSVLTVREHGKRATCLREAASAGMEPLACQP